MKFKQETKKQKIIEFFALFPTFAFTYWLIDVLLHWHVGDSGTHWLFALFWGAAMSATVTCKGFLRRRHKNDQL